MLEFFMAGNLVMMLAWVLRDCDTPVEVMAEKFHRMCYTPLLPSEP